MSIRETSSEEQRHHRREVPRVGRVAVGPSASLPYMLVDADERELVEISDYLRHITADDFGTSSVRSYALALLRWLRFLWATGTAWDRASRADVRDFVLWMRAARPARSRRPDAPAQGSLNPRTGKRYLGVHFAPATINHNLAVVSAFYEYILEKGIGQTVNPVPARRGRLGGGRPNGHHNPLEPFPQHRRAAYRQRVPRTEPRAMSDGLFDELFTAMPSDRDRAILALYVSTGARPSELLGLRASDVDYGEQVIAVIRKGTRETQWLPASPDAFVWLRLYQRTLPRALLRGDQPVWWTLRRPWRQLDYDAMRAVFRRVNRRLETNWTLHDLRHTCAIRMANDPKMPLVTVQTLLGHAHLTTTQRYLKPHLDQVVAHIREHHRREAEPPTPTVKPSELGYDDGDLRELFGWQQPEEVGH